MSNNLGPPSRFRRIAPWLFAVVMGIGLGLGWTWWFGVQQAPQPSSTRVAAPAGTLLPDAPPRPAAGPPMTLTISNRDCNWGADFAGYYRQASDILRQAGRQEGRDAESVRMRVPDRPWNGLTVSAVEAIYEGSGIIFAEPLPDVRAALASAGVRVADDGGIPMDGDGPSVQAIRATSGSAVRYGATVLTCGA